MERSLPASATLATAVGISGFLLAGCAGAPSLETGSLSPPAQTALTYQLNDAEKALDCNKLIGRVQVRILQVRGRTQRTPASALSRGMQSIVGGIVGGTRHGLDPDYQYARDRAMLEAYNARLGELGCKTYDLQQALALEPGSRVTPRPVR